MLLVVVMAGALSACDMAEQNYDAEPGNSLDIEGSTEVIVPDTTEYFVRAFTIDKQYEWSLNGTGAEIVQTRREGEFVDLGFTQKGTYSLGIDDGEYTGTLDIQAVLTDPADQAARQGFSLLATAVSAAGLGDALSAGDQDLTVMGPTDAAFLAALDADDDGAIGEGELPSAGVLADILSYHVIADSVGSAAITDGATAPTLLGEDLTFGVAGDGSITVEGASVVEPFDLPVVGGYVHAIDQVLLPPVASSDFNDQESADGQTVTVAGVYLPNGGFIAMHEQDNSGNAGAVVGNSDYLEPGIHNDVEITLNNPVSDGTVLGAMPHTDDGDEVYEFPVLGQDGPYTKDGAAVIDYGTVTVP